MSWRRTCQMWESGEITAIFVLVALFLGVASLGYLVTWVAMQPAPADRGECVLWKRGQKP